MAVERKFPAVNKHTYFTTGRNIFNSGPLTRNHGFNNKAEKWQGNYFHLTLCGASSVVADIIVNSLRHEDIYSPTHVCLSHSDIAIVP